MSNKTARSTARAREAKLDEELAAFCKALGHPARVRILRFLRAQRSCFFGNLSEIVPLSPSTISQHLDVLERAGLIRSGAEQQRGCYCVDPEGLARLTKLMGTALDGSLPGS
ncbi:MAG: winged helix-turn-helix transcriptional regulator [Betaproteobacteria bacterium]|nr:winged helix-turn-helix transcriptional regulator [Betaproteobacteria bacterium]